MTIDKNITNLRDVIKAMSASHEETAFLLSAETRRTVSFRELEQQSVVLSKMLRHAGLEKGDKVAFLLDNGLLTAQLFLGTMYGGYVAVPLNVRAGVVQLSYMLDHCEAKVVFVEAQYTGLLGEALESVRRDLRVVEVDIDGPLPAFEPVAEDGPLAAVTAEDLALLMYSSGSTGKPKGALHTHSSVLAHGRNSIESHQLSPADRSLLVLPLYHINAECVTLIPTLLSGGSVVVAHRFVVSKFWDWVDDLEITWSALVPTIISELVDWDDPGKERRQKAFARIRFLRSSSAPLSPSLHRQFLDKFNLPLLQAMGSTEGGNVFSNPQPPGQNKIGSPGLPWGFEARIVDREGVDVPAGESGEVLLRGPALMLGYYKDPEGTAAVVDSEGWLHTGDLARRDEDGYFFVVGRSKELIIKGGVNIAPRQIDEMLESHPAVLEAAAVGVPDRYFGEDAVAFVVLRPGAAADERELLAFCETRLGHFKAPSRIHFLKELPKGPSGKVQRLRLLDPAVLSAVAVTAQPESETVTINAHGNGSDAAGSSLEQIISSAWAEVLALPQVDPQSNFFALGGHSLLAIQCLSKLRDRLPMVLSLSDFFEFGTIAEQAELVRKRLGAVNETGARDCADESTNWEQSLLQQYVPPPSEEVIPREDPTCPHPLSPAQQGLWFLQQLNPSVPVYNESEAVRLNGKLNVEALESAMNVVVDRQEVLRSTIKVIDEVPHAVIHESWPLRFKRIDLSALPPKEREAEVDRLLIDEPRVPYHLEAEPGIRVTLLHLSPSEHILILMMHHLVCDWASEGIIWRDLSAVYRSYVSGEPLVLPALLIKHGDYAAWQHQKLASSSFDEDLAFWEETLRGAPPLLELPADRPRPPIMSYQGDRIRWKLNSALTEALRNTSRSEKTSLFTIFAAALDTLLFRYSGNDDILLGIPLADRDLPGLDAVVGYLLRVHVLRTRLSGEMTFRDLLSQVQKGALDLYLHRAIPFDKVVQKLQPERNLSYTPVFQVALNWRDRDQMLPFIGLEGLAIESLMATAATTKFDLLFQATDIGNEVWLELEYNTDIFDRDRMLRMLGHYQVLLGAVAADPGTSLIELPLLTASERQQVLYDWNDTKAAFPADKCVHELFEEQVAKTPDAVAVAFENEELSYAELNRRANQLANYLRGLGVKPDAKVAICAERGFRMIVAMLAVLKAGGAYVPLDPDYPSERLRFMLKDSQPVALLTQRHFEGLFSEIDHRIPVLPLDDTPSLWVGQSESNPGVTEISLGPLHLAYIIYTSGSTGEPKGVMVPHRAINRLVMNNVYARFEAGDRMAFASNPAFDAATLEVWAPLLNGGTIVVVDQAVLLEPVRFGEMLRSQKINLLWLTVGLFNQYAEILSRELSTLRYLIVGGDSLNPRVIARVLQNGAPRHLINGYGPTETTTFAATYEIVSVQDDAQSIPIGRPIANTRIYILDGRGQPVPVGAKGELYIAGAGVARGYLNRPELTAERFLSDPFSSEPEARMYRTGDLGRWHADGNIEFLGRNDFQVKIRGFRIELGEIEARLADHPAVREVAVIAREEADGDKRLVAYYTGSLTGVGEDNTVGAEQLRTHLSGSLPEHMIPAAFVRLDALPLTPNGKLDRKALPAPDAGAFSTRGYEPPQGEMETKLAAIWAEVLKIDRVGRHDDFFDLGGHSLTAVRVISAIKSELKIELPVRILFQAQSVAQIAALILHRCSLDNQQSLDAWPICIPIQPAGSKLPLFCVARPNVNAIGYLALSRRMGPDQPVYGLQRQFIEDPAAKFTQDQIAETAKDYIGAMQAVQPRGPYFLIGQCQGAYIAFEMTRQLERQGERVAMLGMLDVWPEENTRYKSLFFAQQYANALWTLLRQGKRKGTNVEANPPGNANHVKGKANTPARGASSEDPLWQTYWPGSDFKPTVVSARIVVFRAPAQPLYRIRDKMMGWGKRTTGPVEVEEISADHRTMLREPSVRTLAERLAVHVK